MQQENYNYADLGKTTPARRAVEGARERWRELESILNSLDSRALSDIPAATLLRMGDLYFETLSDLGKAQASNEDPQLKRYLNSLVGRAYSQIYRKKGLNLVDILKFFLFQFPQLVRKRIHFIAISFFVFLFSTLIGFLCINNESKLVKLVVPEQMQEAIQRDLKMGKYINSSAQNYKFEISSKILFNNIRVSFMAFAMGIIFGLGTIYILIINGILLGGLASIYHGAGFSIQFWSLILPHGGIELASCFIAGGAGLILGYALINPGPYTRKDWLGKEAADSVKLLAGTIPILILAALVESYITPSNIPIILKYMIAMLLLSGLAAYLGFSKDSHILDRNFIVK